MQDRPEGLGEIPLGCEFPGLQRLRVHQVHVLINAVHHCKPCHAAKDSGSFGRQDYQVVFAQRSDIDRKRVFVVACVGLQVSAYQLFRMFMAARHDMLEEMQESSSFALVCKEEVQTGRFSLDTCGFVGSSTSNDFLLQPQKCSLVVDFLSKLYTRFPRMNRK